MTNLLIWIAAAGIVGGFGLIAYSQLRERQKRKATASAEPT